MVKFFSFNFYQKQQLSSNLIYFLKIRDSNLKFETNNEGEFWKILLPGVYTLEVFSSGYLPFEQTFAIEERGGPVVLNLILNPDKETKKQISIEKLKDRSQVDQAEDRTRIYVQKIPKNVYESILNGLNLFNLLIKCILNTF